LAVKSGVLVHGVCVFKAPFLGFGATVGTLYMLENYILGVYKFLADI
jgi:hypothetical protein